MKYLKTRMEKETKQDIEKEEGEREKERTRYID